MNKLTEQLRATRVGRSTIRGVVKTSASSIAITSEQAYIYTLRAELKATVQCREKNLPRAIQHTEHNICEAVYGEFRGRLLEARLAAYKADYERVDTLLSSVLDDMFN